MKPSWLVNGRESGVPASDRGLAYGDGLFETMAADAGQVRRFDLHYERLRSGCERLSIPCPTPEQLLAELSVLLRSATGRCVAKVIVTRGSAARGYRPPDAAEPNRIVGVMAWPDYPRRHYTDGIRLEICQTPASENTALAGLKHLCRLEHVLAQAELKAMNAVEGLMLTPHGYVIGGTMSNVFCVENGTLLTPQLDRAGVCGIMRSVVMAHAAASGWDVRETDLTLQRLTEADEVFVTNAVLGLWPAREIGAMKVPSTELGRRLMREVGINDG